MTVDQCVYLCDLGPRLAPQNFRLWAFATPRQPAVSRAALPVFFRALVFSGRAARALRGPVCARGAMSEAADDDDIAREGTDDAGGGQLLPASPPVAPLCMAALTLTATSALSVQLFAGVYPEVGHCPWTLSSSSTA